VARPVQHARRSTLAFSLSRYPPKSWPNEARRQGSPCQTRVGKISANIENRENHEIPSPAEPEPKGTREETEPWQDRIMGTGRLRQNDERQNDEKSQLGKLLRLADRANHEITSATEPQPKKWRRSNRRGATDAEKRNRLQPLRLSRPAVHWVIEFWLRLHWLRCAGYFVVLSVFYVGTDLAGAFAGEILGASLR